MGFVKPWLPAAERQNRMVARAAARAVSAFAQELYAVFVDGVIGQDLLAVYVDELRDAGAPVHFVRLMPSPGEARRRLGERHDAARTRDDQLRWRRTAARPGDLADALPAIYAWFEQAGDFGGCAIDPTDMTIEETADAVMDACGRGDCLVLPRT
jgi:hypothetical protein